MAQTSSQPTAAAVLSVAPVRGILGGLWHIRFISYVHIARFMSVFRSACK